MNIEKLKDIPEDPSLKAQAELEQRLIEREIDFLIDNESNGSFAITIEYDGAMDEVEQILGELELENMNAGKTDIYPWLKDVFKSGNNYKAIIYYSPETA